MKRNSETTSVNPGDFESPYWRYAMLSPPISSYVNAICISTIMMHENCLRTERKWNDCHHSSKVWFLLSFCNCFSKIILFIIRCFSVWAIILSFSSILIANSFRLNTKILNFHWSIIPWAKTIFRSWKLAWFCHIFYIIPKSTQARNLLELPITRLLPPLPLYSSRSLDSNEVHLSFLLAEMPFAIIRNFNCRQNVSRLINLQVEGFHTRWSRECDRFMRLMSGAMFTGRAHATPEIILSFAE